MSVGARALLQGATVAAAAASCGYTDEKAFSEHFTSTWKSRRENTKNVTLSSLKATTGSCGFSHGGYKIKTTKQQIFRRCFMLHDPSHKPVIPEEKEIQLSQKDKDVLKNLGRSRRSPRTR